MCLLSSYRASAATSFFALHFLLLHSAELSALPAVAYIYLHWAEKKQGKTGEEVDV